MADVARLEEEVAQLLQQLPTADSNAAQVELLHRAQEISLHRDPTPDGRLLGAAVPLLQTLLHQQNAPLVAAILALLAEAARRHARFFKDLFEAAATVLLLSFSSEKNALKALDLVTSELLDAFQFVVAAPTAAEANVGAETWQRVAAVLEYAADLVHTTPLLVAAAASDNNNRSAAVFLRAWKLLERAVLLLSEAKDASVYRDPARSNVQPDTVSVDLVAADGTHAVLQREPLVALGDTLLRRLIDRLLSPAAGVAQLTRRELCVAINSLSLVAAVRPQLIPVVIPALIACHAPTSPGATDRAVQSSLKANLVKLLSHPAAQELAEEVTECIIALNDGERAFRAISKSKDPRRKYVSAPSEASLRRARIGKRTAEQISESFEQQDPAKRARAAPATTAMAGGQERITPESLVNMPSSTVLNLVLAGFAADMPPTPRNLALLLAPSELKARMSSLLAKLATPSSVLALETSIRRSRDPRRRRESHDNLQQPSLLSVFDEEAVEETSDWVSKNSTTVEEPLVSLAEDNSVQVFLKPMSAVWCRDMASAALSRILENEYGTSIRGDDALRETLLCRLASSPWFLLTDERNSTIHPSKDDAKLPPVYQTILDFVQEDVERRTPLATALLHHEYVRVTAEMVQSSAEEGGPPLTGDVIYRKVVEYFLSALVRNIDLSSSSARKLFGRGVASLPRLTVEAIRVIVSLFAEPHKSAGGTVLGITVLRELIRERKSCEGAALQVLLRFTCDSDDSSRSKPIQCVANQLYVIEGLKKPIEEYAIRLVESLEDRTTNAISAEADEDISMGEATTATAAEQTDEVEDAAVQSPDSDGGSVAPRSARLRERLSKIQAQDRAQSSELHDFARELDSSSSHLENDLDNEVEVLRRLELYVALCAKKPVLLGRLVSTYGHASELVRQVIFQAIEKLIKHLKQRSSGSAQVVAQLHGFEAPSLGLVCHIIQILSARTGSKAGTDEAAANAELVAQVLALWESHKHIPDSITVLIPIVSSIPKETMEPLLPPLLALPQSRWSVAMTRVFEAMPPQLFTPIDLLIALHHVDLKQDATMQKKVILGINFCLEHRHAFPAEVLHHVCRVLLQEEPVSKLALRTLILSVTAFPSLQQEAAQLLRGLVARRVWEMQEDSDALWKGFIKCAALIQPASFPILLHTPSFPLAQLESVLHDEPELRGLLREYISSPEATTDNVHVDDVVRALLLVEDGDVVKSEFTTENQAAGVGDAEEETADVKDAAIKEEAE